MSAHRQTEKQQQKTQQQSPGTTGIVTDSDTTHTERHIDNMFPDEASLEGIEVVAENMRRRLTEVRGTLRTLLRAQSASAGQQQQQSVEATKAAINELHQRISEMKAKARTSERMVLDITQDIKALDFAKRNVTQTTTTMRRLQMLIAAVGQLRQLKEQRRWGEAATVVAAVTGLTEGFADFGRVRPIATLLADAQALQRETAALASTEVERGFDAQGLLVGEARKMRAACECAQALGAQPRVTEHYCKLQMRAYAAIFQLKDDVSQLENVSRRYAWLRRILRNYAESHAEVFPDSWRVAEHLSRRFAEATRDQLGELMATHDTVSAEGLTAALADTLAFEAQCNKKFGIVVAKEQSGGGTGPSHVYESSGEPAASFMGAVSCAFEPYMSIFIRGEQTKFETLVARFQAAPIAVDDDPSLSVLASSTDLLYQFRESLRQCASLSTGQAMLDLAHVFSYSMSSYARDVLIHKLPQSSGSSQQLEDLKHVCLIVNTADYCASVVAQLEIKIVERIDEVYKPRVSFAACRDALLGVINKSIRVLVAGVEGLCEPAFAALSQVPWQTLQTVGDQSAYVSLVSSAVKTATESIRGTMSGARYLRSYCDKFAVRFAERYMEAINTCGGISEVGAEQLLLDAQALKSMLLEMPRMGSEDKKQPVPATYQKIVSQGVGRIEALLKAILAPSDPPEALVDRFLLLFPKAPREVFQQVLRLKSVRPGDQPSYQRLLQRMLREISESTTATPSSTASATTMAMTAAAAVGPNSMSDRDSNRAIPTSTNQEEYSRTPLSLNQEQQEQRTSNSRSGEHLCLNGNNASSNMAYNRDPSFSSAQHRNSTPGFSPTTPGGASAYKNHGRSPLSAREGQFRPDPLGITGGGGVSNFANEGMVVSPRTLTNIQSPVDLTATTGGESSMADGNNSPVLASLAANATATRTKLNENLRKFMSNMRRN